MNRQNFTGTAWIRLAGVAALVMACAVPAAAQTITSTDIQRLQDQVYQAGSEVARARGDVVSTLQSELDDLRDEVVYLKVRLRKEGSVNRNDYTDVRDRLQDLRSRARGDTPQFRPGTMNNSGSSTSPYGGASGGVVTGGMRGDDRQTPSSARAGSGAIPEGQEIDVRLENELSSETAQVEQRFEATTVVDLYRGSDVLIPAGSKLRGVVSSVEKATRTQRRGSMTVSFDQITVRGRNYPMRGTVTQAIQSEGIRGEAAKIGTGGAVGAIIGGILGGVKGAVLGVLIGGGGTIAATEGKDAVLPPGTVLRVKLDTPPMVK